MLELRKVKQNNTRRPKKEDGAARKRNRPSVFLIKDPAAPMELGIVGVVFPVKSSPGPGLSLVEGWIHAPR